MTKGEIELEVNAQQLHCVNPVELRNDLDGYAT